MTDSSSEKLPLAKLPRGSVIKIVAASPQQERKSSSILLGNSSLEEDNDEALIPTPPIRKGTEPRVALTSARSALEPRRNTGRRGTARSFKDEQLDLILMRLGFKILYSFHIVETPQEEKNTKIVLAMSPLGTIIAISLDVEGTMTTHTERRVNMVTSEGTVHIQTSYLTNLSKQIDLGSMVICNGSVCLLNRDNLGKVGAEHYDMKSDSKYDCSITTHSPTSYPLIRMSEILSNFLPNSQEVDFPVYSKFLTGLQEQSDKINKPEIASQMTNLKQYIDFMENLLVNLKNIHSKAESFVTANNAEMSDVSTSAATQLQKRLESTVLKQTDADLWKDTQEQLYGLNCNSAMLINMLKMFNDSRTSMNAVDQEAYAFYFTMYSRVIKTMDSPFNTEIRRPDSWTLAQVLPGSEALLSKRKGDVPKDELEGVIREDLASFDPTVVNAETAALAQLFQTRFQ